MIEVVVERVTFAGLVAAARAAEPSEAAHRAAQEAARGSLDATAGEELAPQGATLPGHDLDVGGEP